MKVRLLYPDHDPALGSSLPNKLRYFVEDDLELRRVYDAMADGDPFLREIAEKVVTLSVNAPEIITYRQHVLSDCLAHREVVRNMYAIAVDGDEVRRKIYLAGMVFHEPTAILHSALRKLELLVQNLKQLRGLSDAYAGQFASRGFRQLFAMIADQLDDDCLHELDEHLAECKLPRGTLLSARLTLGNKGGDYMLHVAPRRSWWDKLVGNHQGYGFEIDPRDQAGSQALQELAGKAVNDIGNTVTQSAEHVWEFFRRLRCELGFYLGCTNLHDRLTNLGVPICFPQPAALGAPVFSCRELRDIGLSLATDKPVMGNDVDADGASLVVVTGANEGGKSTFLRSVGAAQVMMQAGMFVTATALCANVTTGVFTHFKREEDKSMTHGKFDEELARMSTIVDYIGSRSMLLCNESFASTNEREGAQIARGIIDAMLACGIKVFYVTHMYDLAHSLHTRHDPAHLFLRAERRPGGRRTFRVIAGMPEPTSHGADSFRRVFGRPLTVGDRVTTR